MLRWTSRRQVSPYLFLSNGYGEDAVGAAIARELRQVRQDLTVWAAPVVGEGLPYRHSGISVVVPTRTMPSGGIIGLKKAGALWQDLRSGLIALHWRQARALSRLAARIDLVVGVGDRLILYAARWLLKRPLVFVAIADSAYLTEGRTVSNPGERKLMRDCARVVFTRDPLSAELLKGYGVPAAFVGNPMMDAFDITGQSLGPGLEGDGEPVIAILAGSRQDAYVNFRIILDGVACSFEQGLTIARFIAAWSEHLPLAPLRNVLDGSGWRFDPVGAVGDYSLKNGGLAGTLVHRNGATVAIVTGRFGDVIHRATLVIGMAGTANEQAAGLGKPVVVCPGIGPSVTRELVRRQQLLLGDAVMAVEPHGPDIARAVREILGNPDRYRRMSQAGQARMGPRGGARRIAQAISEELTRLADPQGVGTSCLSGL